MDESNDKTDKSWIIFVWIFDAEVGDICTPFLDMPVVNIGNASNLFAALKKSLQSNGLDFNKCMAFMSDTTNIMKGCRSGVQSLNKRECPDVLDVGCICHLADLTIKAGMGTFPVDIDKLFIDVFYYFCHSSKRKQEFTDLWCSLFTSEPKAIIKHCATRWLSLLHCIGRFLHQFDGLKSYFLSCDEAETSKVVSIIRRLENPLTKPLLLFLSFILPSMDRFNRLFQKSTEITTCQLYSQMSRLVRLFASNILKPGTICSVDNLSHLSLARKDQLDDENLGVGTDTWTYLSAMEEDSDPKPFYTAVRNFYVATLKMLKKLPFGDSILNNLGVINPEQVCAYSIDTVKTLAARFPQLELADTEALDQLQEEFMDFTLSPGDHHIQVSYSMRLGN